MGEARVKAMNGGMLGAVSGDAMVQKQRVRVVQNIRMENLDGDGITMLMLGDQTPELAVALAPPEARTLAEALLKHAAALDAAHQSRIIIPGGP